jgi:hypothetical protein
MIRNHQSRMTKLTASLLAAAGIYLAGGGAIAHAKTVVVRPGDRVIYRDSRDDYRGGWRDDYRYRGYDGESNSRYRGRPPWAASWDRSERWRNYCRVNWRNDWRCRR